eukprot:5954147-Amphidinium_carterae.1
MSSWCCMDRMTLYLTIVTRQHGYVTLFLARCPPIMPGGGGKGHIPMGGGIIGGQPGHHVSAPADKQWQQKLSVQSWRQCEFGSQVLLGT